MEDDSALEVPLTTDELEDGSFSDAGDAEAELSAVAFDAPRACGIALEAATVLARKSLIIGAAITYFSFAQSLSDGRAATIVYALVVFVAARAAALVTHGVLL